ncbi:hypothetical protein T439DRAFT_220677 [Meredithblackwellia eburnea MCA 4105]
MPVDVFLEICAYLTPPDFSNIAQASKTLRALILSPSCASLWQISRRAIGVPELECDDLTDTQLVTLFYSNKCQKCGKTSIGKADFTLRKKYCKACRKLEWIKPLHLCLDFHLATAACLPKTRFPPSDWNYRRATRYCSLSSATYISNKLYELQAKDAELDKANSKPANTSRSKKKGAASTAVSSTLLTDFIKERKSYIIKVENDGDRLHSAAVSFKHNLMENREEERISKAEQSKKRYLDIRQRCLGLGYSHEDFYGSFRTSAIVNKPELLTEDAWTKIQPSVIRLFEKDRAAAAVAAEKRGQHSKQNMLRVVYEKVRGQSEAPDAFLIFGDFLFLEHVRPFWESESDFDQEKWDAAVDSIKADVKEHSEARRILAIRTILSATSGTDLNQLNPNPELYPEEEYGDEFFERFSSHLFCTLPSCRNRVRWWYGNGSNSARTLFFDSLPSLIKHQQALHSNVRFDSTPSPGHFELSEKMADVVQAFATAAELNVNARRPFDMDFRFFKWANAPTRKSRIWAWKDLLDEIHRKMSGKRKTIQTPEFTLANYYEQTEASTSSGQSVTLAGVEALFEGTYPANGQDDQDLQAIEPSGADGENEDEDEDEYSYEDDDEEEDEEENMAHGFVVKEEDEDDA